MKIIQFSFLMEAFGVATTLLPWLKYSRPAPRHIGCSNSLAERILGDLALPFDADRRQLTRGQTSPIPIGNTTACFPAACHSWEYANNNSGVSITHAYGVVSCKISLNVLILSLSIKQRHSQSKLSHQSPPPVSPAIGGEAVQSEGRCVGACVILSCLKMEAV